MSIAHHRETILAQPGDAFVSIVDSAGIPLTMPDGVEVVMENHTYETKVLPQLISGDLNDEPRTVVIDAAFALEKDSIVVDVVQTSEGGAEDVSRTYWLVRPTQVFSAKRPAGPHAVDW